MPLPRRARPPARRAHRTRARSRSRNGSRDTRSARRLRSQCREGDRFGIGLGTLGRRACNHRGTFRRRCTRGLWNKPWSRCSSWPRRTRHKSGSRRASRTRSGSRLNRRPRMPRLPAKEAPAAHRAVCRVRGSACTRGSRTRKARSRGLQCAAFPCPRPQNTATPKTRRDYSGVGGSVKVVIGLSGPARTVTAAVPEGFPIACGVAKNAAAIRHSWGAPAPLEPEPAGFTDKPPF
jgi:hypothetical protein